jgi:wyosine [tRNA(Phe)-imidazoG37] synthetase (radical SAM superfamily)
MNIALAGGLPSDSDFLQIPLESIRNIQVSQFWDLLSRLNGAPFARLLLGHTGHARLTQDQLTRLEQEVMKFSRLEIDRLFPGDAYLTNFVLNVWEWAHGRERLESLPWNISLPISDVCNARCSFCTSWIDGRKQLTIDQLVLFAPALRTAVYVGLVGHGEPFSHPGFADICERLDAYMDPRTVAYTITNGVYLDRWLDHLGALRLRSISVSLNAATPATHQEVMGLDSGDFSRIVETLGAIIKGRVSSSPISVSITMVVTKQNIHEVPQFIKLGNDLKVASIYLRTLSAVNNLPPGLNYHLLPAYEHPDFRQLQESATKAIAESAVPVFGDPASWQTPVLAAGLAQKVAENPPTVITRAEALRSKELRRQIDHFYEAGKVRRIGQRLNDAGITDVLKDGSNPIGRQPPFRCRAVYNGLYVNRTFMRMTPCCYITQLPGYEEVRLDEVDGLAHGWNSESYTNLRRTLRHGPLYGACERCPEHW